MRKGVMRPGHVQIRVLDVEAALKHYRDLVGLIETDRDEQGRIYLKAWTEVDKFSVVLNPSDEPGMDFMGFKRANEQDCKVNDFQVLTFSKTNRHILATPAP